MSTGKALFDLTTLKCSKLITQHYSTSFTLGIRTLDKKLHMPIYAIYGFVRYADEIVDTFHEHDKRKLLQRFRADTYQAIEEEISLNPVLHAFQMVVNEYNIPHDLIEAFLTSMAMDLENKAYDEEEYKTYIYGSAEVVGLMCLCVFCKGDRKEYERLKPSACALGAAFQKVNFLRDMRSDYDDRGRVYFPHLQYEKFDLEAKRRIEEDIQRDFDHAYSGIIQLPKEARLGVYLAYVYYLKLFNKIKKTTAQHVLHERIRVPDSRKMTLLLKSYFMYRLNAI